EMGRFSVPVLVGAGTSPRLPQRAATPPLLPGGDRRPGATAGGRGGRRGGRGGRGRCGGLRRSPAAAPPGPGPGRDARRAEARRAGGLRPARPRGRGPAGPSLQGTPGTSRRARLPSRAPVAPDPADRGRGSGQGLVRRVRVGWL